MKKIFAVSLMFLALSAVGLFANGGQETMENDVAASEMDSKFGGVLVFGRSGDSVGLDSGRETDGESFYGSTPVYDTLVEFVPGETAVQPALAETGISLMTVLPPHFT